MKIKIESTFRGPIAAAAAATAAIFGWGTPL